MSRFFYTLLSFTWNIVHIIVYKLNECRLQKPIIHFYKNTDFLKSISVNHIDIEVNENFAFVFSCNIDKKYD